MKSGEKFWDRKFGSLFKRCFLLLLWFQIVFRDKKRKKARKGSEKVTLQDIKNQHTSVIKINFRQRDCTVKSLEEELASWKDWKGMTRLELLLDNLHRNKSSAVEIMARLEVRYDELIITNIIETALNPHKLWFSEWEKYSSV